ncbi:MAG: metal ABC transporter permease [Desulfuromonas sp.]|nr:metal ABC transporter permease [Desulfuromonas sp.]
MSFFNALVEHQFLQYALFGGLLASIGCGIVGSFVVVRRIGYMAGGIAHAVLGGMGLAYFLGKAPISGALISALCAAVIISQVSNRHNGRQHEDTIISALWAVGMSAGILFIAKTPGYNVDLMSYLFGNILMISAQDLTNIIILDSAVLLFTVLFFKQLLALCYDAEFATLRGVHVNSMNTLLLCMVAVTVVILIQIVGIILVIAMLTLPAATARLYVATMPSMMLLASILGMLITCSGLGIAYCYDLPTGATTALIAGIVYLCAASLPYRRLSATS